MSYTHSTSPGDNIHNSPTCYFSYVPHLSDHWSLETPVASPTLSSIEVVADPRNPLLAARVPPALLTPPIAMDASRLLQLQTAAAHPQTPSRSQSRSDYSGRSSMSSESSSPTRPSVRCSRCQTDSGAMVKYAMTSYYCSRCAGIVGYGG
jgi:hypothetical protein